MRKRCGKIVKTGCEFHTPYVGATIGRPWILLRKIHRRKAKDRLFSCGKSEKRCFSAGDRGSPLHSHSRKTGFNKTGHRLPLSLRAEGAPQGGLSCPSGNSPSGNLLEGSSSSYAVPGDSHGALPLGMTDLGDCAAVWRGRSRRTISALRRRSLRCSYSIRREDVGSGKICPSRSNFPDGSSRTPTPTIRIPYAEPRPTMNIQRNSEFHTPSGS